VLLLSNLLPLFLAPQFVPASTTAAGRSFIEPTHWCEPTSGPVLVLRHVLCPCRTAPLRSLALLVSSIHGLLAQRRAHSEVPGVRKAQSGSCKCKERQSDGRDDWVSEEEELDLDSGATGYFVSTVGRNEEMVRTLGKETHPANRTLLSLASTRRPARIPVREIKQSCRLAPHLRSESRKSFSRKGTLPKLHLAPEARAPPSEGGCTQRAKLSSRCARQVRPHVLVSTRNTAATRITTTADATDSAIASGARDGSIGGRDIPRPCWRAPSSISSLIAG